MRQCVQCHGIGFWSSDDYLQGHKGHLGMRLAMQQCQLSCLNTQSRLGHFTWVSRALSTANLLSSASTCLVNWETSSFFSSTACHSPWIWLCINYQLTFDCMTIHGGRVGGGIQWNLTTISLQRLMRDQPLNIGLSPRQGWSDHTNSVYPWLHQEKRCARYWTWHFDHAYRHLSQPIAVTGSSFTLASFSWFFRAL